MPYHPQAPRRRSAIPLALGITLIVGGGLLTLEGLLNGAGGLLNFFLQSAETLSPPGAEDVPAEVEILFRSMSRVHLVSGITKLVQAALSILALVAGIGLVGYRPWARSLALGWATAAVVYVLANTVVMFEVVMPMMRSFTEAMRLEADASGAPPPPPFEQGFFESAGAVAIILGSLMMAIAPVLTWILLTRRSAEAALSRRSR